MKRFFAFVILLFASFTPNTLAAAFEVPLLTWERGRIQQVVLGGGAYTNNWQVTLEGNGIEPLSFAVSEKNTAGYVVYSLDIPLDLPLGPYSVITSGTGSPKTVVAGVSLVQAQNLTPSSSGFDLTLIVAIFASLTALINLLRSDKYRNISYQQSQDIYAENHEIESFDKFVNLPQRIRYNALLDLRKSLFSFLLIQEGEMLYRISRPIFGFMPIFGLIAGTIAGVEVQRNGGVETTGFGIFVAVLLLSILDPLSGIFATISFWAIQLFSGDLSSIRDLLIVVSVSLAWLGAPLISALVFHSLSRDNDEANSFAFTPSRIFNSIISALFGAATFFLGSLLVNSLIYTEAPGRIVDLSVITIITSALLLRRIIEIRIFHNPTNLLVESKSFYTARAVSPAVAVLVHLAIFGFVYIWTESAVRSLLVSTLFSLPYYLAFIKFGVRIKANLNRNLVIETFSMFIITLMIYSQIANRPLLIDQMSALFLFLTSIPIILHAAFSAIYSKSENWEIIES